MNESNQQGNFLKELSQINESSIIRSESNIKNFTTKQIANFCFSHVLVLYILANEFDFAVAAVGHAARTIRFGGFKRFNHASTDLYVFLHILLKNSDGFFRDQAASSLFLSKMHLNEPIIKTRLRELSYGKRSKPGETSFLIKLEKQLKIDDSTLKSCRRLICSWDGLENREKRLVVTRLLQFLRHNAPLSDLLVHLEKLSKSKRYEIQDAANPDEEKLGKQTVSKRAYELMKRYGYDPQTATSKAVDQLTSPRKKKITELFDTSSDFNQIKNTSDLHIYKFELDGYIFEVDIREIDDEVEISFSFEHEDEDGYITKLIDVFKTPIMKNASKVFSTVYKIIQQDSLVAHAPIVLFTTDVDELSRKKLYDKLAPMLVVKLNRTLEIDHTETEIFYKMIKP